MVFEREKVVFHVLLSLFVEKTCVVRGDGGWGMGDE